MKIIRKNFFDKIKNIKFENGFLIVFILLSLIFSLILPPDDFMNCYDEFRHYKRVYSISEGQLLPDEFGCGYTDKGIFPEYNSNFLSMVNSFNQRIDNSQRVYVNYEGAAIYPFAGYLLPAAAVAFARLFTHNSFILLYAARLAAWLPCALIIYFALKKTPVFKKTMAMFMLTAVVLQECMSINASGISYALTMLLISEVLFYLYNPSKKISVPDLIIIFFSGIVISLSKTLYAPMALLVICIPRKCFGSTVKSALYKIAVIILTFGAALFWAVYVKELITISSPVNGVNSSAQITLIQSNPVKYLLLLIKNYFQNFLRYFHEIFGGLLGHGDIVINTSTLISGELALIICVLKEKEIYIHNCSLTYVVIITGVILYICCVTGEYLQWTPVGKNSVDGVQGRYFIPLVIPALIVVRDLLSRLKNRLPPKKLDVVFKSEVVGKVLAHPIIRNIEYIFMAIYLIFSIMEIYMNRMFFVKQVFLNAPQ